VQFSLESHPQSTVVLVVGSFPELLMKVSADDAVKPEAYSEREIVVNFDLLRGTFDRDLFNACPAARVLLHNRFLQIIPLGLRIAVSSLPAEKPWHLLSQLNPL
jgi:hypothetical protein